MVLPTICILLITLVMRSVSGQHENQTSSAHITGTNTIKQGNSSGLEPKNPNAGQQNRGAEQNGIQLDIKTILTFLAGATSTALIVCIALCLVGLCTGCRTVKAKKGNPNRADANLEAVKIQQDPAGVDQTEEDEHTPLQRCPTAEATVTAAVSTGNREGNTPEEEALSGEEEVAGEKEQKEVDYACIDYSLLQGRDDEAPKPQIEETEYAEIQIQQEPVEEETEIPQDGEVELAGQETENQEQVEVGEAEM